MTDPMTTPRGANAARQEARAMIGAYPGAPTSVSPAANSPARARVAAPLSTQPSAAASSSPARTHQQQPSAAEPPSGGGAASPPQQQRNPHSKSGAESSVSIFGGADKPSDKNGSPVKLFPVFKPRANPDPALSKREQGWNTSVLCRTFFSRPEKVERGVFQDPESPRHPFHKIHEEHADAERHRRSSRQVEEFPDPGGKKKKKKRDAKRENNNSKGGRSGNNRVADRKAAAGDGEDLATAKSSDRTSTDKTDSSGSAQPPPKRPRPPPQDKPAASSPKRTSQAPPPPAAPVPVAEPVVAVPTDEAMEQENITIPSNKELHELFDRADGNGNGQLSLAEIDKLIMDSLPKLNHKPAIMRAYKAADRDGSGWIKRSEFPFLIRFIIYYNGLWQEFELAGGADDRRISRDEFVRAAPKLGIEGNPNAVFDTIDENRGGFILFDEFCSWRAKNHIVIEAE